MSATTVVYVHGIWMPGHEMLFVKYRLQAEHGFPGLLFDYPSVGGTLDDNADLLAQFIEDSVTGAAHLVGHSLGGVLCLRALSRHAGIGVERVVCLGSPLRGSRAAAVLEGHGWGNAILGKTITAGVVQEAASQWASGVTGRHEVGVIAGNVGIGLGKIVTSFEGENDGTVAVSETRLDGLTDHLVMPINHTGLILSRSVADQAAAFLKRGEFLRET